MAQVAHIRPDVRAQLLAMSDRTMSRLLSGEARLDCPSLQDDLVKLCDDWSDFRNLFCPCKMLVSKEKRPDGKGYKCTYDKPRTPYQRVPDEHVLTPEQEAALKAHRSRLPRRNGALQARMQAPSQDTAHLGGIRQGQACGRRPLSLRGPSCLGASRHPFGDGRTSPRRDTPQLQQPAHEPRRGTKIECPVFGKPKTTKLSTECLFYLTNWDPFWSVDCRSKQTESGAFTSANHGQKMGKLQPYCLCDLLGYL